MELAPFGRCQKLIVGNTAPQEKGQPGGQFEIADPVNTAGNSVGRIAFAQEQEVRRNQQLFQGGGDAVIEVGAAAAFVVYLHQRRNIRRRHGTAIGMAGQGRDNRAGTCRFRQRRGRSADEYPAATWRIARTLYVIGADNRNLHDVAHVERLGNIGAFRDGRNRELLDRNAIDLHVEGNLLHSRRYGGTRSFGASWNEYLFQGEPLGEGGPDGTQTCFKGNLHFVAVVGVDLCLGLGARVQVDLNRVGGIIRRVEFERTPLPRPLLQIRRRPYRSGLRMWWISAQFDRNAACETAEVISQNCDAGGGKR